MITLLIIIGGLTAWFFAGYIGVLAITVYEARKGRKYDESTFWCFLFGPVPLLVGITALIGSQMNKSLFSGSSPFKRLMKHVDKQARLRQ